MDPKQSFYITCAIPYTNAPAHIGHALEFVQSDVLARYHRALGKDVILAHGADEHGSKNYKTALELGIEPQAFADDITPKFVKIHEALNISHDRFIRTSSPEHKKAAQAIWKKLVASGDIYKSNYEGLYCVGCEAFVTDAQAKEHKGICPIHEKPYEKLVEENYFFRLSKYLTVIEEAIKSDALRIVPTTRKHEALALIGEGLSDLSASRPIKNLPWGVPVPGDKEQVMYVWFEALMYYLTALDYPGADIERYWPAQVQVIGKDILRFHALIWPAILLSAGLELSKALTVHGFVSSAGKKMSKSLGNVIDPFEVTSQYGADPFRYYLLRHIPSHDDGDFTWEKFEQAYNSELADDLGNLIFRTASMISRYQDGAIGQVPDAEHDVSRYHEALAEFQFDRAIDMVWEQIHSLNQYIDEEKPWELAKEDKDHLSEVLGYLVGSLLQIAGLLDPLLPATAQSIKDAFKDGVVATDLKPLFPKIYKYTPDPKAQ